MTRWDWRSHLPRPRKPVGRAEWIAAAFIALAALSAAFQMIRAAIKLIFGHWYIGVPTAILIVATVAAWWWWKASAADVIGRARGGHLIVAQCKHTTTQAKVGVQVIYTVNGTAFPAHNADVAVVITNGSFTGGPGRRPPSGSTCSAEKNYTGGPAKGSPYRSC